MLNEVVSANDRLKEKLKLPLDTLNRKVTVHLQNKVEVYFSDIGQNVEFSSNKVISSTSTAERAVDLEHGFHDLYVYYHTVTICRRRTRSHTSSRVRRREG